MFTFLKNWIFILQPSNTQVQCRIPCYSQKPTYIYTIFQLFNVLKKYFQNPFIYRVSQKTNGTFNNHVYIPQKLNLHSTTQVVGKIPCHSEKSTYIYTLFQLFNLLKNTFRTFLYIGFHKKLTELLTITFTFLKNWISILQLKLLEKFPVILKNPLTFIQYFNFSIY